LSDKSISYEISSYSKSTDLLYEIEDGKNFDIVFTEIKLHDKKGINTAKLLRSLNYSGEIILTAQNLDFAIDGYEVNACGYVLMPICQEKLFDAMDRAIQKFSEDVYFIKHRGDFIAIPVNNILFIESSNTKCIIHAKDGEKHTVYTQLRKIETELNDSRFLRCHQSYLVNMNHICKADKCFELTNGEKILIRQRNLKEIRSTFLNYIDKRNTL
jgi:DNA-binding LytR/AlgR family response regulator